MASHHVGPADWAGAVSLCRVAFEAGELFSCSLGEWGPLGRAAAPLKGFPPG